MADTMSNQQFSEKDHAEIYNIYRPDIPAEIGRNIVSHLKEKYHSSLNLALDIGCGSGQSTVILAPYFNQVVGIDVSKAQIDEAEKSRVVPKIIFKAGPAEDLPFPDASVQLVTACAALHWFQAELFFSEVKRVLSPNGIFAAYTYHFIKPLSKDPACIEKIDNLFAEKYEELYPYFSQQVFSSLDMYKDVCFPFDEVQRTSDVRQTFNGRLPDVIGYIETLSGFQNMKRENVDKAGRYVSDFSQRLKEILMLDLEPEDKILTLYRDFYIVLCRKSK